MTYSEDFNKAFHIVMMAEGGYVNDPHDPGGQTRFGVSKRAYPDLDIRNLTWEQAREIYHRDYWKRIRGDSLPWPLNVILFDAAVNQGVYTAVTMLQRTVGVTNDGIVGPRTLRAVNSHAREGTSNVCVNFLTKRALRYTRTKGFDRYGGGWFRRLFKLASLVL